MSDMSPVTLEQRLTNLEGQLRKANERIRELSDGQRTSARVRVLAAGGVTLLLIVLTWVVPTPAQAPSTFTAPFTVQSAHGESKIVVGERDTGLFMSFYNHTGSRVLFLGVDAKGVGLFTSSTPDSSSSVEVGFNADGDPGLSLTQGNKKVAELGPGTTNNAMGLRFWNNNKEIIGLGNRGGNGYLQLADSESVIRVQAGTELNGDGAVKVFGPTGACGVMLAGIPCMIVAR